MPSGGRQRTAILGLGFLYSAGKLPLAHIFLQIMSKLIQLRNFFFYVCPNMLCSFCSETVPGATAQVEAP